MQVPSCWILFLGKYLENSGSIFFLKFIQLNFRHYISMNQTFFLLIEKLEKKILLFLKREIKLCVCVCVTNACGACVWQNAMTDFAKRATERRQTITEMITTKNVVNPVAVILIVVNGRKQKRTKRELKWYERENEEKKIYIFFIENTLCDFAKLLCK